MNPELKAELLREAEGMENRLVEIRRDFHRHPELSGEEERTARRVSEILKQIPGISVCEQVYGHGLLAELKGNEPGPTVCLRSDLDALPVCEETGFSYRSERERVMHACGHDFHMTMLLGAAELLSRRRSSLSGTVRFIFEPSEETSPVGGSRGMIAAGALKNADAVFGMHCWPSLPAGVIGFRKGAMMAASDHILVRIKGKAGHAAKPELGRDALIAGASFALAAQSIVSRSIDPLKPLVITFGRMSAGSRYNIIAGECELEGTCRSFDEDTRSLAERRLREILQGVMASSGCEGSLDYERGYDAVINDPEKAAFAEKTAADLFGAEFTAEPAEPSMIAEDFSFYLKNCPGAFCWFGTGKTGDAAPLHSPVFDPEERVLWRGSAFLSGLVLNLSSGD